MFTLKLKNKIRRNELFDYSTHVAQQMSREYMPRRNSGDEKKRGSKKTITKITGVTKCGRKILGNFKITLKSWFVLLFCGIKRQCVKN